MKTSLATLLLAASVAATPGAFAATTVSTSGASFFATLAPGAYTNTFAGLSDSPPASFTGNGFGYTISALDGLYSNGDFIGSNEPGEALKLTFTGAPVTAVGANFYATDGGDAFAALPIMLTLSDGTHVSFTPGSVTDSYRGFSSTVGISSLTITGATAATYVGLDNLTVGVAAAVPEPATGALMAAGFGAIGWLARRRGASST